MTDRIEFQERVFTDPLTNKKWDAVAVIRNGHQVALLPEANRLKRALALPLNEIECTFKDFSAIMGREPTKDEKEFWKAVLDYKRSRG